MYTTGLPQGQKIRKSQEKRGVFEKMSVKVSKFDKKKSQILSV